MTRTGIDLRDQVVINRLGSFINQFYKILPIKESGEATLTQYMTSLQREMLGCQSLIIALNDDALYLSLLAILQFMIDNECDIRVTRSEVFKAINILKKMQRKYDKTKE